VAELQQREGCSVQGGVGKNEERPSKVKIPLGPEEHACSMSNADALDVERGCSGGGGRAGPKQ
jgi:hypothetical protein